MEESASNEAGAKSAGKHMLFVLNINHQITLQ